MKLKTSTLVLMAIALVSAGSIYIWTLSQSQQTQTTDTKKSGKSLFDLKETDITQVKVETKGQTLQLEKTTKGWQIITPKAGPADEGTVAFLLNLLATGTSERTLQADPAQLKEFGLDQPRATLSIQLKNQSAHGMTLGKQTFNQSAVYARIDPQVSPKPSSAKTVDVLLVPTGFLDAINRPLSDWQGKPSLPKLSAPSTPQLPQQAKP